MKIFDFLKSFNNITVFALVGPSGTGKSFRAKLLADKYSLEAIIDDGLLIQHDKILAGQSAKREKTYMGAVRVALFDDKGHRDQVAKVLQKMHIKKILILGTSEKMVQKIAMRLQLPAPSKIIKIEDIATKARIDHGIEGNALPANRSRSAPQELRLQRTDLHALIRTDV